MNPAPSTKTHNVRLLSVADLHQERELYRQLFNAVREFKPDVVGVVGDCLDFPGSRRSQLSIAECATALAGLDCQHLAFIRGNHEDTNWSEFVRRWPFSRRPLTMLYGSGLQVGPLELLGFPCALGWEAAWIETLPEHGNDRIDENSHGGRKPLSSETSAWLSPLLERLGPVGRTCWLMHEPPVSDRIANLMAANPRWTEVVEHYQPMVVISGHDHESPFRNGAWYTTLGTTICVNVGQSTKELHFCLIDFQFKGPSSRLPMAVTLHAFPTNEKFILRPR